MAYTVNIPPFSFVRFNLPDPPGVCCPDGNVFLLPVVLDTDIAFQFSVTFSSSSEADAAMSDNSNKLHLLLLKGNGNTPASLTANTAYDWTAGSNLYFNRYRNGLTVTYTWTNGLPSFAAFLKVQACFQLAITGAIGSTTVAPLISNTLRRHANTCFSSVIAYGSDNNYAGFTYCNVGGFLNRIRLPFYLQQPQPKTDRAIYRQSGGVIRKTKSVITKEYTADVNYLPEYAHDRLTVALEHDTCRVESDGFTGDISASDYNIKWEPDEDKCNAKAEFKATPQAFFVRRANCSTC